LLDPRHATRLSDCWAAASRAIGQFCDHPLAADLPGIAPARGGDGAPAASQMPGAADFMTWCDVT